MTNLKFTEELVRLGQYDEHDLISSYCLRESGHGSPKNFS